MSEETNYRTHSVIHSIMHSVLLSFIHSFTPSFIYFVIHLLIHSFILSFIPSSIPGWRSAGEVINCSIIGSFSEHFCLHSIKCPNVIQLIPAEFRCRFASLYHITSRLLCHRKHVLFRRFTTLNISSYGRCTGSCALNDILNNVMFSLLKELNQFWKQHLKAL